MREQILTSIQNPLVKQMRKLHRSKERREQNLLLLEGTNLLESACRSNYSLVTVCCTLAWKERHPQLWQQAIAKAQRVELVTPEIIEAIATTVNPDGAIATATRKIVEDRSIDDLQLGLVLERLQDPGNLGTIIRTAVAANADRLWLSDDSVDLDNPKVLRASVGEWFRLPIAVSKDLTTLLKDARQRGIQIVSTLPQATTSYWQIDFTRPTILLLGNEGAGLSKELASLANLEVNIPVHNQVESLNVAIAAALLLYEFQRQQQQKTRGR